MKLGVLVLFVAASCSGPQLASELVYSYSAADGEHAYGLDLYADGRWERSEHTGWAIPKGKLSPKLLWHFRAALAKAPFQQLRTACNGDSNIGEGPTSWGKIHDRVRDRAVRTETPCGSAVDEWTDALTGCLIMLIEHGEDGLSSCPIAEGS